MKKLIVISLILVFVLSMGILSFAETTVTEAPEWFQGMLKWKKEQIQEAVKDEVITEEQAKLWNERLDSMEKYHEENGFNFPGGCGGGGFAPGSGRGPGAGRGFGTGMMGRGWNAQNL